MNTEQALPAAPASAQTEESAAKPRSRRKPKAEAAADAGAEKPRARVRRTAKTKAADANAAASPEVMQARALAQISQASVVRAQRQAAERAAEMIAPSEASVPEHGVTSEQTSEAAPVQPKRGRKRTVKQAEKPAGAAPSDSVAAPDASAAAKAAPADVAPNAEGIVVPAVPLVDPALRPHRRGRKPKAYVEAEKAAAAALAAQQAALMAARDAAVAQTSSEAPAAGGVSASQTPIADAAPAEASAGDMRPGRSSRAKQAVDREAASAPVEGDGNKTGEKSGDRPARRTRQHRRDANRADADSAANTSESGTKGERSEKGDKADKTDKADRAEQAGKSPKSDRFDRAAKNRERRERQQAKRKERNNRFAPTEPSLTREELAAMKVAELREKAKELEIDIAGKKKAELVEEVYTAAARAEGFREIEGILDLDNQGFGYIRAHGYMPSRDDAFVPAQMIRAAGLRAGDLIAGTLRPARVNDKFPGLAKLRSVNGMNPEDVKRRPKFADLTPIYPNEPLKMEHGKDSITGRAIDIVSPIGKGQRGLIVSPPKAGKTTILKKICQSIAVNNPEVHLICLLVDERPEEVTDMQRSIKGDVVASTFDMPADNHTRVSELVIERAKRIVEMGGDVVVVLDSITRLARAYNLAAPTSGRILSGGVDSAALYPPKRFLGAARNIENGGSLTILASALVDTGSKMDEVIFEEFKGTGNMELKLDRDLADRRIFPAIDPIASGTRNEDLLVDDSMRPFVWGIRRILANMNNTERAAASFIKGLKGTNSNQEFLIRTAKKAADHPDAL